MKSNKAESCLYKLYEVIFRQTMVPLFLMITTPVVSILLPYIIVAKNSNLKRTLLVDGWKVTLTEAWMAVKWNDWECWLLVVGLVLWGIISLHFPGRHYYGPPTSNGFRPEYWHNGFVFWVVSTIIAVGVMYKFPMLQWYYKIPTLTWILVVTGFVVCLLLYVKGLLAPDPGICNITGNPIFDYYWGVELYPHLGPFVSLKILIICRFGLYLWQLIVLMAWKANYELYTASYNRGEINWPMTASAILQTFYLAKFYYWEDGYMMTIDTSYDRFGYYVCWGCWAFVPTFFTLQSLYLVKHSPVNNFNLTAFVIVMLLGISQIAFNYWTDRQKQVVRATNGKCKIWGRPAKVIRASYLDDYGKTKQSILLASGFWSIARHLNYTFELLSGFLWSVPALFNSPIPYFYIIFLTVLIVHRTIRDDDRCYKKYGSYWKEYCKLVPYKMIPGIY